MGKGRSSETTIVAITETQGYSVERQEKSIYRTHGACVPSRPQGGRTGEPALSVIGGGVEETRAEQPAGDVNDSAI